jgi:ankyrin repeat protein
MKSTRRISLLITFGLLTALMIVSMRGELDGITDVGLGNGDGGGRCNRALMLAVDAADLAGVKQAIARGAQPGVLNAAGYSVMSHAVTLENVAICNELLEHGADADGAGIDESIPPIVCAAIHHNVPILDLLIRHGANVNARTSGGNTALNVAAAMGHEDVVAALIRAGADVNAADAHGWTPLMSAVSQPESAAVVENLLIAGAHPDVADDEGRTAMNIAARGENLRAIELLLRRRRQESHGRTLLGMSPPDPSVLAEHS